MTEPINPDIEKLARVAGMTQALYDDPEIGPELDKLIEKKFPDAKNPRATMRKEADSHVASVKKIADEVRAELRKEQTQRELAAERAAIREFGFNPDSPDDIKAVEELMEKETIGSHRTAAEVLARRKEVASAGVGGPERWQMPGEKVSDRYKGILDNRGRYNPNWGIERGYEAFNELQAAKRAGGAFGL